jgi:antirestriction protein ArdC
MTDEILLREKFSVHKTVTAKIVAAIEAGCGTCAMPWHVPGGYAALPTNAATCAEYRGINILALWIEGMLRGYPSNYWASYRQWTGLGAQVRKGERGAVIVFYKRIESRAFEIDDHDRTGQLRFVARASWVFNRAQVDGYVDPEPERPSEFERCASAENFVRAVNAQVKHGSPTARYCRNADIIEMPEREWFLASDKGTAAEGYYAVLLHELTHWSGAPHRLNREFGKRFGDESYAMEELVAELGAAFMCAALGISTEPRPDHAAYVASWLKVLGRDSKAIFTAASLAQEAFEHLAHLATLNGSNKP